MDTRTAAIYFYVQLKPILLAAAKIPLEIRGVATDVSQVTKHTPLSVVPQHNFTKDKTEGQVIYERFDRARRTVGLRKIRMCPRPESAMPVSTVVPLKPKAERIPLKTAAIERDLATKTRVGMRRA